MLPESSKCGLFYQHKTKACFISQRSGSARAENTVITNLPICTLQNAILKDGVAGARFRDKIMKTINHVYEDSFNELAVSKLKESNHLNMIIYVIM